MGEAGAINLTHLASNCLAKGKVLYKGHAVAAIAATNAHIAEEAGGIGTGQLGCCCGRGGWLFGG